MNYINAIGFVAAAFTAMAYLPQAIKTIRTKQTKDLSLGMYVMLVIAVLSWLIYGSLIGDWPIILTNGVNIITTSIILILKIRNG